MQEFVNRLGIDWRLLASQAINFLVVIFVLWYFAYGPLLKIIRERRKKIEAGLENAEEAERRLTQTEVIKKEKLQEAESEILIMFKDGEAKMRQEEERKTKEAESRVATIMKNGEMALKGKQEAMEQSVEREAVELVKETIKKVAAMEPKLFDEAMIEKALREAQTNA